MGHEASICAWCRRNRLILAALVGGAALIVAAIIARPPRYKALWDSRTGRHSVLDTRTGKVYPNGVE